MTTWTSPNKSTVEKSILSEDGFIMLSEDGTYMLQEDDFPDWGNPSKNTSTWSSNAISLIDFNLLIDNTYSLLIDNTYNFNIGTGQYAWSSQVKN